MLNPAQVSEFKSQGYLRGNTVLTDAQVEVLRTEVERVIEQRDRTDVKQPVMCHNFSKDAGSLVWQIVNIWEASAPYAELTKNPTIGEEMGQLTVANALRIWHDQIQYKPADNGGVNMWHQDAPLWPIIAPMTEVTAWVALDDVDVDNGCMSMVPGSHLWGDHMDMMRDWTDFEKDVPSEFEGHEITVKKCPVKKGEVHYHHSLTWHGSHANKSGRNRRAIALHYMTEETHYVASGDHPMKPFVTVADGELLQGEHFPLVWERN